MKKIFNTFALFIVLAAPFQIKAEESQEPVVSRAAFDLGSGRFKVLVAEVQDNKIKKILASDSINVALAQDFAMSGEKKILSEKAQEVAIKALLDLKDIALKHNATEFSAVATAVFRKATNGQEILDRLIETSRIPICIVTQKLEGMLGFETGAALSPEFEAENMIVWDSGNASFQMSVKEGKDYKVFEGPLGMTLVKRLYAQNVKKDTYHPDYQVNPMSLQDFDLLVEEIQKELGTFLQNNEEQNARFTNLKQKLQNSKTAVVAIGDAQSAFNIVSHLNKKPSFTREEVRTIVEQIVDRSNDDPIFDFYDDTHHAILINVALLYSVMKQLDIQKVDFKLCNGTTPGLLINPNACKLIAK